MKYLEIELYKYNNLVFGKVIYQDPEIKRGVGNVFECSNGFSISSETWPQLTCETLYIGGVEEGYDDRVFWNACCDSLDAVTELTCRIEEAVREYNDYMVREKATSNPVEKIL